MHDDETLAALEWQAVCAVIAEHTNAPAARDALLAWRSLPEERLASEALAEVAEGIDLVARGAAFPAPFVEDQQRTLRTLAVEGAVLDGPALISAARTLEGVRKLAAFLRRGRDDWPRLAARFRRAPSVAELERRLLDAFDVEARIVDAASRELRRLREEVRSHRTALVDTLDELIAGLAHVLVAADSRPTVREGRYVVPIRREALSEVPGIVHDESASGATVFLEPHSAIDRNNALRHAELAVRREEERILRELTAVLAERRDALEHAARLALHAETVLARGRYALAVNGNPPTLGGDTLELVDARHPLLLAREAQGEGTVVPLSLELGPGERTLVVTGPNTGGKTVLLKTVGTAVLMAQSGVVPPVGAGTRIPWHGAVFADIGDAQSIAQDLSTFTAHLTRLKAAWDAADRSSLILVDEIGASTDPAEGAALASALLEAWTERGARTIVTTHYHALKVLASSMPGLANGSLAYDLERNLPEYRFVQGVPGRSFGIELAERWGFGAAIVEGARSRLERGVKDVEAVIDRLAAEEQAHREARSALEAEVRAIGEAESARARRSAAESEFRRAAAERRLTELEDQLERLRAEVRDQGRRLRERAAALAEAEAAAAASRALAADAERAAEALRAEREALTRTAADAPGGASRVAVGARVRIPRYDVVGEVVELDAASGTATVQAGQVRIACRASECEIAGASGPLVPPSERGGGAKDAEPEVPLVALEVDLRGLTADEVAFPVAGALERAYRGGNPAIRFIHGKGSGVLRARVGDLLRKHPYVRAYRLGHWNEGGDGVTIAAIAPAPEPAER
ncbi:MAG TPA: Smr/MutS family protein [Gemmatimonadota bacterium]|nr:Smr/MutS family protein [Gemmatimonadota bacterium]